MYLSSKPEFNQNFIMELIVKVILTTVTIVFALFNKTSIVTPAEFKGVICVRSPDCPLIACRLVSRMAAFKELQQQICAHTGISPDVQQLLYGNKLIQSSSDVERLPNEAAITLKLKLLGGGNCDICYSNSVLHVCDECDQMLCTECNDRVHQHPKRMHHKTSLIPASQTQACPAEVHCSTSCSLDSQEEDDTWLSPSTDKLFSDAFLIATLADQFGLTSFKPFQKEVIEATLDCSDTLVVQPTGSGKSLCFQFPPVHQNQKSVVITPTIRLMQDQVNELERKEINSVYLGSAQLDKQAEMNAMDVNGKEKVIFVTPEWIAKVQNQAKLQVLAMADKLSLIAVDEAHLVSDWSDFRKAYSELEKLKIMFPDVPIMALTATATPDVEGDIKTLLRNPLTVKASINRPNITLNAHEVKTHTDNYFAIFAMQVCC